jgi:hypothetical protein
MVDENSTGNLCRQGGGFGDIGTGKHFYFRRNA